MRSQREILGISQRDLCVRLLPYGLDIDPSGITRLELGQRLIRLGEAIAIADVLQFALEGASSEENRSLTAAAKRIRKMSRDLDKLADGVAP